MFKYLINDEVIIFNSTEERAAGLKDATANGYSIERLEFDEDTDVSKAPDSAFSQIMGGESPEDFLQDPAESADAVSETVAQEDTELILDDGSTELPSGENYNIDGKPVTKEEYEIYDAEVKADKPLELTLSEEDYELNKKAQKKLNETPLPQEWDFWSETGTKIQAAGTRSLGKLARIPIFLKEMEFAYSKAFLSEEEQARIDALPPKVQQAMALMAGGGSFTSASMVKAAALGLEKYEESVAKAKEIEETLTKFDTTIVDQYAAGNFAEATARTISDALGSIPSVAQAMIPYVGIASIVAGEAAGASGEIQEEGEGISAKTMGYSLVRGASEGLLEITTKKIGKGLFKSLTGKPKDIVVKELKDIALNVGKEYGQEGLSESATLTINTAADLLILGRKDAFDGYLDELGDTFLVGAAMGGGMSGSGAGVTLVKQGIQARKINEQLKKTDYKNLTDAYKTNEVPDGLVNLSLNPAVQAFLNKDLDTKVSKGDLTIEESDNIKKNFANTQGAAKAIKASTVSDANAGEATELLTERARLESKIDAIGDKSLSGPQQLRVETINVLINKLVGQGAVEASTKKADAILKQLGGKGIVEVNTAEQITSEFDLINKEDQKLYEDAKQEAKDAGEKSFKIGDNEFSVDGQYKSEIKEFGGYGSYVPRLDGSADVFVNKALAFEDGMVNTGAHEVLHYALKETLKSSVAQKKTGTALLGYLSELQVDKNINKEFEARLKQYKDNSSINDGDTQEEVLTLLSEAMLDGKLTFNESTSTKLLDFGRRLLSSMGFTAKFNTGKDVFNFIKDYNRSINKGKLDKGLAKSLEKGVKGKLTDATIKDQPKKKQSAKPSLTISKVDAALTILEEAEALRDEDFDNPTLQQNVEKAEAAYDQALIEEQNAEEDAAEDAAAVINEITKEKIVRPKADKTKRRYSLDTDVKKELEPKIAEAQALNKKLIAEEKELNKKLIADIEAIPDKEVKRTEKDKRIADLKNNPRRVAKTPDLNKLEREITKELKTPIDKAVNLFTKLYYDKISDNAKTAVTRDEFKESARAEITSITINEFKPKTVNRQGENVVNDIEDIIFQRGGLRLRNLAERLGVVGKDQGIARGAEALIKMADSSSDINFDENDKDSVRSEEKRKVSALLASVARYDQAREQVVDFWKENEGNTKVENFKKLPNLINNILAEMFNVTEGTLTARSGNLNKADYANAIKAFTEKQAVFTVKEGDTKKEVRVPLSEVGAFQDGLNENKAENKDFSYKREANESIAEALLRFLPQTSADDYTYASGRKGRFSGKSTGLPKNLMGLAYKIDGRKTTGIGNVERTAQKLTIEEIYDAIGATIDSDGNVTQKMGLSGKNKEGQTMLGLIKLLGRMVTNEISRTETDLDPMTKMDLAAGKNRSMYSLRLNTRNEVILKANKDIENLKRVTDIPSADIYINDVKDLIGILDSPDLKVVNKTIFSSRSKLIAINIMRNNSEISKADAAKEGKKITDYIKNELDKLKEDGILNKRKTVGTSTASMQFPKAKFGGYVFAIDSGALVEQNKNHAEIMRKSYISIYEDIAEAKESNNEEQLLQQVALWARFTEAASMERTHFLAMGAANIGYEAGLSPKDVKAFEHAFPVADMGGKLLATALDSNSKKEFIAKYNDLVKNYVIIGLSKENANKVGKAGYNSTMPEEANFWWQRYLNEAVAAIDGGINPHNVFIRNNKGKVVTLSEYAGWVDNAGKPLTKKLKEFYQEQAKAQPKISRGNIKLMPKNLQVKVANVKMSLSLSENFDKAMDLGNSLDQETKGISVWDFDDTLATTKSSVLYTMPGAPSKVTEKEFNNLFKQKTVYYHGTSAVVDQKFVNKEIVKDFPEGASSFSVQMQGLGKHYTKSLDNAKSFIDHRNREDNTGTVAAVSISTDNPKQFKTYDELLNDIKSTVKNKDLSISERNKKYLDILKSEGFDSITYKEGPSYNPGKKSLMAEAVIPFDSEKKLIGSADYKQRNGGIVKESAVAVKQNELNAEEFAKRGDALLAQGAEFDFSEFSKVVKGAKGPFFEKAMARNKKFGNENVYILTARPANSALAIHEFLKGIGLDIPLANITGLANSDPQAKANWVVEKFAEGYNDFYFADDHIGNVKAVKDVLSVLDVKSKVQQARVKNSLQLSKRFNEIIEEESGIESFKEYQSVKATKKGAGKGKFKFFVPPSAEDFLGLLYTTLPKGKKGESAMAFYKEHLLDPYGKAVSGLRTGRITIAKNYKALKKELGIVPRKLKKRFKYEDENGNTKESLFTKEDAIRVYTWDAQGFEVPGLSNVDLPILVNYVNSNPDLKAFADKLLGLNKNVDPKAPTESWPAGTITSDLLNTLNTDGRKQLLEVWQQNVDAIFTPTNLNKLEAAYGKSYVTALKDSLRRMRTGRNSTPTNNNVTDGIVRWLNAAVGNIMFLNRRSAVLQLISFTNFINFEGNNLYQAGKAFANQPQYWKDWVMLMNSDYLVDRRDGLKINVNEADIATTAKENGFQGVLAKILQVGFIPTKMADSAAIATGGASFYRNKVNALIKGGMNKAAAEKQAMEEFIATAEVSQQSSDPSKISKQQAEPIGRIILAFANTPSQYARIIKRAAQDLKNGRGDAKTHLSRIVYYGVLQNVMFNFLQQAMFAAMMGDDEDEETEELTKAKEANIAKKSLKVANSMTDGILRGIGVAGAVVSVAKNLAIKLYERSQKTRNQNLAATIKDEVMKISPPISSKLSKAGKVGNAFEWGKKEIEFDKMSLKHPYVTAATNTVAAVTGLPLDRAQGMAIDAADIASDETETWMKPLIALGWPKWQLMSEEDTKKEREDKKERFKELESDKEFQELNPTNQRRSVIKKLSKKEQEEILWNSGVLTRKQIRNLKTEANRVDKIMGLQNKKQFEKDMEALSRGEDIGEMPKVERPKKKRKDSLK